MTDLDITLLAVGGWSGLVAPYLAYFAAARAADRDPDHLISDAVQGLPLTVAAMLLILGGTTHVR